MAEVIYDSIDHQGVHIPVDAARLDAARAYARQWADGSTTPRVFAGEWPGPAMEVPEDLNPKPSGDVGAEFPSMRVGLNSPLRREGKDMVFARMVAAMAEGSMGSQWARMLGVAPVDSMEPCVADYESRWCRWWLAPDGIVSRLVWLGSRDDLEQGTLEATPKRDMLVHGVLGDLTGRFHQPLFRVFVKYRSDRSEGGVVPHLPTRFMLVRVDGEDIPSE